MPLSLPLMEHLVQLKQADQERSQHSLLGQVRQEIGSIMKTHCTKSVNENNVCLSCLRPLLPSANPSLQVYLEMYQYFNTSSRNKVVNWYGVVLKLHQVVLQSGVYSHLKHIAARYILKIHY